ncbi:BlaR1 family beta-lactam sensor/signal transducer [Blautia hansenii]|uniref:Regulatory protein blaR1 n=1 Tax=Blautia hansenii DSM 20583 TaxID=537007 RepID=C9LB42_BLAHA|nr:BlaR1 family beta-lactam sensor/signal transducer [Blautia hansenii]ASM69047.1 BlaR1 family beta-lactam sensor/signal transducer [Blautia hansenii DSM 20583]EEX20677.1 regulatory protein blaR1 [Blautia hansenii DSM 20583]UWO11633.1 BlaR1 family beta-lactam sensor/signal transducer [Blautia hansenii DSM 20583]
MDDFMFRFLISNLLLCGIIGVLLLMKRILKNSLSSRMQYNLWFLLLGLLAVPFMPFRFIKLSELFVWFKNQNLISSFQTNTALNPSASTNIAHGKNWMEDFTLSVNKYFPPIIGYFLFALWILGIITMLLFFIKSAFRLRTLKKSALPLQNPKVHQVYQRCLKDTGITKNISVYSTVFLKSPVIVGVFKPCIYLPIHLISDSKEEDIRYMLLHELQHYKHKDGIVNYLMSLAGIVYWFHPLVRYALKEMRNDREIACDTSVLKMLKADDYVAYGNTLLNLAGKLSLTPHPFVSGISGNMKQMKRRILSIASYEKPTAKKKRKSMFSFLLVSFLILGFAPFVSTYAADKDLYLWDTSAKNCSKLHLSNYFEGYEGSFVLYDLKNETWKIHNKKQAVLRIAPNSTYKIYNALFALETGIIKPESSLIEWNGTSYPFEAWNKNQTLQSAMNSSVNWYFQSLDEQLGAVSVQAYLHKIGYGNEDLNSDFSSYWMEASLKISPIEQVELLTKLQQNSLNFTEENMKAVKDAIHISSSDLGDFYGKTGTGRVNGQDINGWFIGFVENPNNTYFFATNIHAASHASGIIAAEITLSILADMNIWKP